MKLRCSCLERGSEPPPDTDDYLTAIIRYGSSQE
jgi:hypothetical protein